MQDEPVHPTLQAQPAAPEPVRPVTAHPNNTTISRNPETGTLPPEYEKCVGIMPVANGNFMLLSTGAIFQPMVDTPHPEQLEARLDRIEAAIRGIQQQSQTCNRSSGGRGSLRPFCRRVRSFLEKGTRRLRRRMDGWLRDQWSRSSAYLLLIAAKLCRVAAWMGELPLDDDEPSRESARAEAAEFRLEAEACEKTAWFILKCLDNGLSFEGRVWQSYFDSCTRLRRDGRGGRISESPTLPR